MNRRLNWISPWCALLIIAITVTLFPAPGAAVENGRPDVSVNINTADPGELMSLPGIGASKATAIVSYRSEHGPFTTIDELANVQGIGKNILEKIRDLVRIQ